MTYYLVTLHDKDDLGVDAMIHIKPGHGEDTPGRAVEIALDTMRDLYPETIFCVADVTATETKPPSAKQRMKMFARPS